MGGVRRASSEPSPSGGSARGGDIRKRIGLFLAGGTYAYQADIIFGAHDECVQRDLDLICFAGGRMGDGDPRSYAYDIAAPRHLDAVIMVPGTWGAALDSEPVQMLLARYAQTPMCVIGARWGDAPSVCIDNFTGVLELTRHLIEMHGRRRLAFIAGRGLEADERQRGFERALAEAGLSLDPALLYAGDYSLEAGRDAAARWCSDGRAACDAIVAANDWMAAGALEVLQERGLRVPKDVSLIGFDDIDQASFMAPPLTTIRQPPRFLGAEAVTTVAALLAGLLPERNVSVRTFPQIRRSCGCFGHASALDTVVPRADRSALESLAQARPRIVAGLVEAASRLAGGFSEEGAISVVDALTRDLAKQTEVAFIECLRGLVEESARHGNITAWHHVVSQLRAHSVSVLASDLAMLLRAETLFGRAYVLIGEQAELSQGQRLLERQEIMFKLEDVSRAGRTALDWPALCQVLGEHLPRFRIPRCYVATGNGGADSISHQVFAFEAGQLAPLPPEGLPFETSEIVCEAVRPSARTTLIVHPMFMRDEILGYACFEVGPRDGAIFKTLGDLISSALKAGQLARALVEEVTRRERAERGRMRQELDIAARIQTAILPKHPSVPGLELATVMQPATEVGGDYFDVLPCPGGCWIGIGDVAGHGLSAGLVMLMIQSIVAATVYERPEIGPGHAWQALNGVLSANIRERMGEEEHATLSLLRYERSGRLTVAGAHEDLIVYRPSSGRCTRIATPGVWVGVGVDIPPEATEERVVTLEPGDVLVLYTDGVIEAQDASGDRYGIERLERVIESSGHLAATQLCEALLEDVRRFMHTQHDDLTLLVARQCP
ncbi:MAG TPA: SpoIIE family protein phosphatase [Polyangiaceae bacterium]|nr:SpoIIE family protein phosphatase [Polyangiaceae bacterium]